MTAVAAIVAVTGPMAVVWAIILMRGRGFGLSTVSAVAAVVGAAAFASWAATSGRIDDLMRWLEPADWGAALFLVPVSAIAAGLTRRRIRLRVGEAWLLWVSLSLIALATIPARRLAPLSGPEPVESLRGCVVGLGRYVPQSFSDVADDVVPNLILYAPLGFVLALAGVSRQLTAVTAVALASSIESYQALCTHSVCAPRDVLANTLGALVGSLLVGRRPPALRRM